MFTPLPEAPSAAPGETETQRQVVLLRREIRRLRWQMRRQAAAAAAAAEAAAAELATTRAALADTILERDTILASSGWRAVSFVQRLAGHLPPALLRAIQARTAGFKTPVRKTPTAPAVTAEAAAPACEELANQEWAYEDWVRRYDTLTEADRAAIRDHIAGLGHRPLLSIVMTPGGAPAALVQATIGSLNRQLYPHWELCAGGAASASGAFLAFVTPGDLLAEHALYEVAVALDADPLLHLVYTDEDRIDDLGRRTAPMFKPRWNIEAFLGHGGGQGGLGRLAVYRRSLLPPDPASEAEAALALRVVARSTAAQIRHIPAVLYHRRVPDEDRAPVAAEDPVWDALRATHHLPPMTLSPLPRRPGFQRLRLSLPAALPRVTAIIPTRDRAELLARATAGLLYRTDYPDLEVLIIDNDSIDPWALALFAMLRQDRRVTVRTLPGPFNYAALNNAGVRAATGDILLLLNNDIDVTESGWLRELVSHAVRPDVGAVGAKLIYADERIQHAGVVLGVGRERGDSDEGPGVAGHFGHYAEADEAGYLGQYLVTREVSAVTGACLALRREVYLGVGGLDEANLPVSYNDVDLCLRIRDRGLRILWTPFATLYHLESASRGGGQSAREFRHMRDRWGDRLDDDPFYNPNFDRKDHGFRLAAPPRRRRPWERG